MANSFTYKRDITTQLKVTGILDSDTLTIDDGEGNVRNIKSLLREFNGGAVEIVIKVKDSEEFDEPSPESDEYEEE